MTQRQNAPESFLQYSQLFRDRPDGFHNSPKVAKSRQKLLEVADINVGNCIIDRTAGG
jgi:hypothetical protein